MSLEDDLFNVPNDEDDIDENDYDNQEDVAADDIEEDVEDDDDENDENDDEEGDGEDNDDDENDDNENEGDVDDDDDADDDDADESKFIDAKETQSPKNGIIASDSEKSADEARQARADASEDNKEDDMEVDGESDVPFRQHVTEKARQATVFDIIPSVSIPYTGQCHALALSDGPKWILTGGEDGFIRKYDFIASIEGKSPLTMAQKHNLVDSVTKAGVIVSYWENEQPMTKKELMESNPKIKAGNFTSDTLTYEPKVRPVYALECERNGYWCLSGVDSGGISLYTMRYNEGALHHYFRHGEKRKSAQDNRGHNDTISALKLTTTQDKFLSGSWDKSIRLWDLNTGQNASIFGGATGQISNIQFRPLGLTDFTVSYTDDDDEAKENSDMGSLFGDSENEEGHDVPEKPKKPVIQNSNTVSNKTYSNDDVFMSSSMDGTINIWDVRASESPILSYGVPNGVPPWCMSSSWSNCGDFIYVGRRNSTIEELSLKMPHKRHSKSYNTPNVSKTLHFPKISGPVTAVCPMPNNDFLLCGSNDNIRLYNLKLYDAAKSSSVASSSASSTKKQATPFLVIPGHSVGILSHLHVDDTGRFMVGASGNRGWGHSNYTDSVLIYEIDFET